MCAARVRVHVRVGACVFVLVVWQGRASACVLMCVVGGVRRGACSVKMSDCAVLVCVCALCAAAAAAGALVK